MKLSDLDQISLEIGALRADNDEAKTQRTALFEKIEEVSEKLSVIPALSKDIEEIKPQIEEFKKLKNRGYGVVIGVAITAGGAGAGLLKILQSYTSGN